MHTETERLRARPEAGDIKDWFYWRTRVRWAIQQHEPRDQHPAAYANMGLSPADMRLDDCVRAMAYLYVQGKSETTAASAVGWQAVEDARRLAGSAEDPFEATLAFHRTAYVTADGKRVGLDVPTPPLP